MGNRGKKAKERWNKEEEIDKKQQKEGRYKKEEEQKPKREKEGRNKNRSGT